jgi:hypothetical protein
MVVIEPPSYQERVLFVGANGSGKSRLAAAMLGAGYRWVAIDLKGDFPAPKPYVVVRTPDDWRWRWVRSKGILYRPKPEYANGPWLDAVLHRLYVRGQREGKRKPFVVYVDEGLALSRGGHTQWLSTLAVAGRSLGVGLWVASQRPRWIPVEVRTEAWRLYVFYLQYEEDEREVMKLSKGLISEEDFRRAKVDYSFWELRRTKGGKIVARHYPPLALTEEEAE